MKKIKIHEQQLKGHLTREKKKNKLVLGSGTYLLGKKLLLFTGGVHLSFNPNPVYHFMEF